jgi:hypothetical protein
MFKFVMTVCNSHPLNFYFGCMLMGKDIKMNVSDSPVFHYFLMVSFPQVKLFILTTANLK